MRFPRRLLTRRCTVQREHLHTLTNTRRTNRSTCLPTSKGSAPPLQNSRVVYQLTCELCHQSYVGETGRPARLRYNEHLRHEKNMRGDSPWGATQGAIYLSTFREQHPQCQPEPRHITAKILQRCDRDRFRKIAESLWIRQLRPALNTNIAAWAIL